jgi:hypothetical protein
MDHYYRLQIALFLLAIHLHVHPLSMTETPQAVAVPHPAHSPEPSTNTNGVVKMETDDVPLEDLERELPVVYDDQIYLKELLQRVVQTIYAELSEMAETYGFCPNIGSLSSLICDTPDFPECRTLRENGHWQIGW